MVYLCFLFLSFTVVAGQVMPQGDYDKYLTIKSTTWHTTRQMDHVWNPFGSSTTPPPLDRLPEDEVIVPINPGKIVGKRVTLNKLPWTPDRDPMEQEPNDRGQQNVNPLPAENDVVIFTFLGVPYAEKPEQTRRFKPPQKIIKYPGEGVIRALTFKPVCSQDVDSRPIVAIEQPYQWDVQEDCLYLNIFTPQIQTYSDHNYPVIVYFHGGGFQTGSANDWPAHILSSRGIVVVTANYRLGPFGFLSLGNDKTGNYGLQDQLVVLEWVQDHIYAFSGDTARVTIVGHGAGAVSAGLHMLSPYAANLFHGVAAMSGSDTSYYQVITSPGLAFNNTLKLGRRVGCSQGTASTIWQCITTRSTNDILQAASSMLLRDGAPSLLAEFNRYAFLPTVDRRFIPRNPELMLRDKQLTSSVPYLTGINANDGTEVLLSDRSLARIQFHINQKYLESAIREFIIKRNYTMNKQAIVEAITYKYTYWPDPRIDEKVRQRYIEFASDAYYIAPVSLAAQLHSQAGSTVYMYVNNYNMSKGRINLEDYADRKWTDHVLPYWMGVCHECDLYLLFGFPWLPKRFLPQHMRTFNWSSSDKNASETFMAMWRQFAIRKNPNLPLDSTWLKYTNEKRHYLKFNYSLWNLKRDYKWENVAFWNEYLDNLVLLFTTTYSPTMSSLRKQIVGLKVATGTFIFLFLLVAMLAMVFSYLLYERKRRRNQQQLIQYKDSYPPRQWTPPISELTPVDNSWDRTKI